MGWRCVLDVLIQEPRRQKSGQAFLQIRLQDPQCMPHGIARDKPMRCGMAKHELFRDVERWQSQYLNNRLENYPRAIRRLQRLQCSLCESLPPAREASPFHKTAQPLVLHIQTKTRPPLDRGRAVPPFGLEQDRRFRGYVLSSSATRKRWSKLVTDYRRCEDHTFVERADDRVKSRRAPGGRMNCLYERGFTRFRPDTGSGAAAHDHR